MKFQTFRSAALLYCGEPFTVPVLALAAGAEPPSEPTRQLTARIADALSGLTLQAERADSVAAEEQHAARPLRKHHTAHFGRAVE